MIQHKNILLVFFLSSLALHGFGQRKIDWKVLATTQFEKKSSPDVGEDYWLPTFSPEVLQLEHDQIAIRGYLIVLDTEGKALALSANPFSSCFFCGNAGPESVIELRTKKDYPGMRTDEIVWIKGRLKLNSGDVNQMTYILEDATISHNEPR